MNAFRRQFVAIAAATCWMHGVGLVDSAAWALEPGLEKAEFIYERASFPACHASTVAETSRGLAAAWFGGSDEGENDVAIWLSRHEQGKWTNPEQVADGKTTDGKRVPCWNPVLFQAPTGQLLLFYKVGPSPRSWWGMLARSDDGGARWSAPERLPEGILGPIKNKPILLGTNDLLCPSSTEHDGWRVHVERTTDWGKTWSTTGPLNDGRAASLIQPTLLRHGGDKVQFLCRSRQEKLFESWSADGGRTWSATSPSSLPNPNSGVDAVTLADGRHLLVYNHTPPGDRSPLNVAVSADGKRWQAALILESEPGEYSYPAVIQGGDGLVHITYTWRRERIKHVVCDPKKLVLRDLRAGRWPAE